MGYFHTRPVALVASITGAALMAGALCAPTAALATAMTPKPQKKATGSVVVVVTNSRDVALTELDVTPAGLVLREVAPGVSVADVIAATGAPLSVPAEPGLMQPV